jgi:hypothetical protein
VRRLSIASPDSGAESPVYGEEPSAAADRDPAAKPPWAGGGGRWSAWPVRPVTAILFDKTPSSGSGTGNDTTPGTAASGFAVALGEAFAFRQVYLNYNSSTAAQRAQQLAAFIPASVRAKDPQFGWNGSGTSVAQSTEVAGIDVRSADTAAVTLFSSVNGKPIELGVPLYAPDGGSDQAAKDALASQLPGFFRAFASGDQAVSRAGSLDQRARRRGQLRRHRLAPGSAGRGDTRDHGDRGLDHSRPGRHGGPESRGNLRRVGRRPAGREMVCKGHPCIYAADGNPMTRFASPWAVPRGLRSPHKLTDVHGREG